MQLKLNIWLTATLDVIAMVCMNLFAGVCDAPLDEICCSEAAITTVVMFCGYLVCVCNKGLSQLHGQCVCGCDVVLVSCTICRGIALVLYNRPTGLLVFFFLSICLAVVCYHLMSLL